MKRLVLGLCLLLTALGCSGSGEKPPARVDLSPYEWGNFAAPDTVGTDSENRPIRLSDYKGKVVLVDFWAGWCGPCRMLVPHEKEIIQQFKDRPFVVFGVSADESREDLRDVEKEERVNWRSLWDNGGSIAETWNVHSWPTLFLVDHEGMVRYRFKGATPETKQNLGPAIEALLARIPK
jgi:thiol-disulfide isomerase/thioredoxin